MSDLAAFDLDGTLTTGETLVRFLRRACGMAALLRAAPATASSAALRGRSAGKAVLLARMLAGHEVSSVAARAAEYAAWVNARWIRPEGRERLEWHKDEGHDLVIVSASPELYVRPIADLLKVPTVLATRLEVDGGRFTGRLLGSNVRGAEKVDRLREHLGDRACRVWAYGNSRADGDLLRAADFAFRRRRRRFVPVDLSAGRGRP